MNQLFIKSLYDFWKKWCIIQKRVFTEARFDIEMKQKIQGSCELCMYYEYDEDYECYTCMMDLDEDEMARFVMNQVSHCPYFKFGDDYTIVRKQM